MASRSPSVAVVRRILLAILVLATGLTLSAVSVAVASVSCGNEPAQTASQPTGSPTLPPTYTPYPTRIDTPAPTSAPTPRPTATPVPLAQYQGTEKLVAALTVYIETQTGTGSGFFFDKNADKDDAPRDDVVITNEHVVKGHTHVKVCWAVTQRCVNGTVTDISEDKDIAVIEHASFSQEMFALARILTRPEWGWGGSWEAGDVVYASGYPGGNKARGRTVVSEPVVTEGIIVSSRLARYRDGYFIEHGADVEPGNSGGPLMKNDGYIVGMNNGGNTEAERLELAVPVGRVLGWLESLDAPQPTATAALRNLGSVTTADLWVYLVGRKYAWNPSEWIETSAESSYSMAPRTLDVIVQLGPGRQPERFCNGRPLNSNERLSLGCGHIELPLSAVTGVSARTTEGPMRCELHRSSTVLELVYACEAMSQ